jgi:mannonate dehydratase
MKYFLDKILPEAEKANVKLALHPNDPPTDKKIAGVPCIMRSKAAFDKVFELGK